MRAPDEPKRQRLAEEVGTVVVSNGRVIWLRQKHQKNPEKSADKLIKPTKKEDIELTEEELEKISGGPIYMKYQSPS